MKSDQITPVGWSVSYGDFFRAKLRRMLLPVLELPANRRPFRLFTTSNDVLSAHVRATGAFELEVLGILAAIARRHGLGGGTALDVGANIGNHTVWMASHFGHVVAFEPNPVIAHVLRANTLLNACSNVQIMEMALSDHVGMANLVTRRSDHIGTIEVDEIGSSVDGSIPAAQVKLRTGDEVLRELSLERPVTFIKMDIEGAEVAALEGLDEILRKHQPVVCFEARNPEEGEAVRTRLRRSGYTQFFAIQATRLTPWRLFDPGSWRSFLKRYSLVPLDRFEDRHYAAVFAWTRDLR